MHQRRGLARRAGETTELLLTFGGDVAAATEPDSIHVLDEEQLRSSVPPSAGPMTHTLTPMAC